MKLTPHAQKLADDWLDQAGDLRELVEILGIARGGIGEEIKGHCYRRIDDDDFSPQAIESFIDDEIRFQKMEAGEIQPTEEEMEVWRQAQRDAQDSTRFFIWKVPFTRNELYISTVHGKNGYVDRSEGPFHSVDASLPYGEIVYD